MPYGEALSEKLALVGFVSTSHAFAGSSRATATIDMDIFRRALVIVQAKTTGTAATTHGGVSCRIFDATNTGKCATTCLIDGTGIQMTTIGGAYAYQSVYEVRSEQLGQVTTRPGTGRFFRARLVGTTLKATASVIVLGDTSRFGPASDYDLASVAEIKTS